MLITFSVVSVVEHVDPQKTLHCTLSSNGLDIVYWSKEVWGK
jgi:hypothetical protein